ncbi:hypothetical protein DdX_12443 [Ditylenchus destructor]|uniref:Uncharacterized protein n=1 Tax=Ditylenchus destructor TaxID=166010 RepID=A0AAD4N0B4_9BILA|nr:hypothetical protein DdX_12443 [Ditylenchus destructor]
MRRRSVSSIVSSQTGSRQISPAPSITKLTVDSPKFIDRRKLSIFSYLNPNESKSKAGSRRASNVSNASPTNLAVARSDIRKSSLVSNLAVNPAERRKSSILSNLNVNLIEPKSGPSSRRPSNVSIMEPNLSPLANLDIPFSSESRRPSIFESPKEKAPTAKNEEMPKKQTEVTFNEDSIGKIKLKSKRKTATGSQKETKKMEKSPTRRKIDPMHQSPPKKKATEGSRAKPLGIQKNRQIKRRIAEKGGLKQKRTVSGKSPEKSGSQAKGKETNDTAKRLKELSLANEKLKKAEADLSRANDAMKTDHNYKELEVEKLMQFWTITKQQLADEQQRSIELEGKLQRMKTAHVEQVSLLHKRISMLQLNVQVQRVSATQTDPFGQDSDCSGYANVDCQTINEWSAQKAHDVIRSNDEQLAELITEIENSRLQAQTDFKFAVVQMEQRLRQEHEVELRTVKEEKERQLEDFSQTQNERLSLAEQEKAHFKAELSNQITEQKVELLRLSDKLIEKEAQNRSMAAELATVEKALKELRDEHKDLSHKLVAALSDSKEFKQNAKTMRSQKSRLEKIEEINEILLAEFKEIELERNHFAEQLSRISGNRNAIALQPSMRAQSFGQKLDDIRKQTGGLHLF